MKRDHHPRSRGPEFLVDLAEQITQVLNTEVGIKHEAAEIAAWMVSEHMAFHWGGQNIYFPQGVSIKINRRNLAIWEAFNGNNVSELAQQHGVSEQCIYGIIKAMRKSETARRQCQLFDETDLLPEPS